MPFRKSLPPLVCAIALVACEAQDIVRPEVAPSLAIAASAPVYRVSGGGRLDISLFGLPSEQYGFFAQVDANGNARGQVQAAFNAPHVTFHAEVECLSVEGNEAWMGIVVTKSDLDVLPVGDRRRFKVRDNGQGREALADEMSGFGRWVGDSCDFHADPRRHRMFPWESGNIDVAQVSGPVGAPVKLCGHPASDGTAAFADPNLEAAVRAALELTEADDLTCELAGSLENLIAGDAEITSLEGIQNLAGLLLAELGGNSIIDISPLSGLTSLWGLGLFNNSIIDISDVSGLTSLTFLELSGNSLTDITSLSGLTNLTFLGIAANSITDISALSGLTALLTIGLGNNFLLTDISALEGLTSLEGVFLTNNHSLSNIQPLLNNTGLGAGDTVDLGGTIVSCTDVAALIAKGVDVTGIPPC